VSIRLEEEQEEIKADGEKLVEEVKSCSNCDHAEEPQDDIVGCSKITISVNSMLKTEGFYCSLHERKE